MNQSSKFWARPHDRVTSIGSAISGRIAGPGWAFHRLYARRVVSAHIRRLGPSVIRRSQTVSAAQSAFLESTALFSPDGRWIAYTTDEAGQPNVYVQPFSPRRREISDLKERRKPAVWRADGKELFYVGADGP
jgi:hypothetical protein